MAPPTLELFPFRQDAIIESFQALDKRRDGRLPFRNVNRILASAVKLKKNALVKRAPLPPYAPTLDINELETRCIDKACLESAIRPLLS
jgi:hypothetical protein